MISSSRRVGFSEGKSAVSVDFCLKTLLPHRLFDHIRFAAQNSGQLPFQIVETVQVIEARLRETFAEADCYIDILSGVFSTRHRAEQRYAQHAGGAEFLFMRLQSCYDL